MNTLFSKNLLFFITVELEHSNNCQKIISFRRLECIRRTTWHRAFFQSPTLKLIGREYNFALLNYYRLENSHPESFHKTNIRLLWDCKID